MKNIEKNIAKLIVKVVSCFFYPLKVNKNKITYISYKNNQLPLDMKLIKDEIDGNVEEVYLLMNLKNSLRDKFMYFIQLFKQIYHVNTSKIILIDANNFVISNMKKKDETKIIQIWHATGAIKKFGNDYKRSYSINNYDYITTSSSKSIDRMASAFQVSKSSILPLGVAGTDVLFDKNAMKNYKKEMLEKYPALKGKKVILYAPTFRGEGIFANECIKIDLKKIHDEIGEEYVIVYKLHPIIAANSFGDIKDKIINMNDQDLYKVFSISDMLISDYSAIIYDFSILEKPMVFFAPDIKKYEDERGFYINYRKEMPGKIALNENELIQIIKNKDYDINGVKELKESFFDYKDGKSANRIANLICSLMNQ